MVGVNWDRVLDCQVLPKSQAAARLAPALDRALADALCDLDPAATEGAARDLFASAHDFVTHELLLFDWALPAARVALRVMTPQQLDAQGVRLSPATLLELAVAAELGWDVHLVSALDLDAGAGGAGGEAEAVRAAAAVAVRDMLSSAVERLAPAHAEVPMATEAAGAGAAKAPGHDAGDEGAGGGA